MNPQTTFPNEATLGRIADSYQLIVSYDWPRARLYFIFGSSAGAEMIVAFKDKSFAFEFVRNFGFTYYGGADIGEMMATVPNVVEGDFESWFSAWDKRASASWRERMSMRMQVTR